MKATGNSLVLKDLFFRNLLSFGNKDTHLKLDDELISVIMGENLDTGGEDSRNGVGKSAIIDALCYVLFGKTIRDVTNQKLINKLARKGQSMIVTLLFDKGDFTYLVERSERPSKLLFLRKPIGSEEDIKKKENRKFKFDISRGKTETTNEITELLGFDITLFEFLVANSSESIPFFKLAEAKRREVIEKLFGFTILGERADNLREYRKEESKSLIKAETEFSTTVEANKRLQSQIEDMERKALTWNASKIRTINDLKETIAALEQVDVDGEIELLKLAEQLRSESKDIREKLQKVTGDHRAIDTKISTDERDLKRIERDFDTNKESLRQIEESTCPTCKQHWEADPDYRTEIETKIATGESELDEIHSRMPDNLELRGNLGDELNDLKTELQEYSNNIREIESSGLAYSSVEEASKAGTTKNLLQENLKTEMDDENPHTESIKSLKTKAIKEVDDSEVKELQKLIRHYDFMISLLTDKNSFIRKNIIDKWLPKLNQRIAFYLNNLELPHKVRFHPDMTVEISKFNQDFDYGNLSKGERNRLNIALNLSFQDVFEFMNYRINLLCVDELIDNGICNRGAENTVNVLRDAAARKGKRVLLITHREDIAARVDDMMIVRKENDISRIEQSR